VLAVTASLWLLGVAQCHTRPGGPLARGLARSAYGALLLQGPVLIALALALRPLALPAEVRPWPSPPSGPVPRSRSHGCGLPAPALGRIL
jgi:hypothetical protein